MNLYHLELDHKSAKNYGLIIAAKDAKQARRVAVAVAQDRNDKQEDFFRNSTGSNIRKIGTAVAKQPQLICTTRPAYA